MNVVPMPVAPPTCVEAEQALLGAILLNNAAFDGAAQVVEPEHFSDPLHGRIFDAIGQMLAAGKSATPVTLEPWLRGDPDLTEAGGPKYLVRLASSVVTVLNVPDYARTIYDTWLRRMLIAHAQDAIAAAGRGEIGLDADTVLANHMNDIFALLGDRHQGTVTAQTAGDTAIAAVQRARESDGDALYVRTGLVDFDRAFGGMPKGEVMIIAGRPAMGKTGAGGTIAVNAAKDGKSVLFVTREMKSDQIALRLACAEAGVDGQRARKGWIDDAECDRLRLGADAVSRLPIWFDETSASAAGICAAARAAHRRGKCDLLVIDYLGLIDPGDRYRGNRNNEIGEITRAFKLLANLLDIPVVLLSQLSRQVEQRDDKRPIMSDLRDSGNIEQDAGMIVFLYRPEYYLERARPSFQSASEAAQWEADNLSPVRGMAEWIVAKDRHGDAPRTIQTAFDKKSARFGNLAREDMR